MAVENKDLQHEQTLAFGQALADALKNGDADGVAKAMQNFSDGVMQRIESEHAEYGNVSDMRVLESRGLRTLTSEETKWYEKFMKVAKSDSPKQEIANLTNAMPVTIVDRVIADMQQTHPLLAALNIQNAAGAIRMVTNGIQMASKLGTWGKVTDAFKTALTGAINTTDVTVSKYLAYFVIAKDYTRFNFTFAPMWVDQYIRIVLSECIAYGLEYAAIKGDGDSKPIGMIMDTTTAVSGKYSAKTPTAITNFDDEYAARVAALAVDGEGNARLVPTVLMIVNPQDYIKKIRRIQNTLVYGTGSVDLINNTYPTVVVQSVMVDEGKAVIGIANNYFLAINGGTSGIVEFDDSVQFIEDCRVFTTRVYGQGMPIDNTSFDYLDISGVTAPALPVVVKGTVTTKASA